MLTYPSLKVSVQTNKQINKQTNKQTNKPNVFISSRPPIVSPRSQEEIKPNGTWIPQDSKGECGKRLTTEQIIGGEIGLKLVV